ncbi:sialate O-acetylesterase [Polaribacter glomeratus]|uniref:Sialate O-acetylesterase domain-containing protein n=1 Tax=Polaribacter glomeratus TaxID=102 RepID=A0A2S7WHP2_9FLAO|nr:sialate O-acetylesterase [Polaribacter glomeratus]PQJ77119.1 hypothetical protein BTO16_14825 [Polaribacter glomeratus]TXD67031.1 sialate O-acetylesterase [Polaribacter glomeratus]
MVRILKIFLLLISTSCFSQTKLPAFFGDNMVLQQQEQVAIWGQDNPGVSIEIKASWGEQSYTKTAEDGTWKATLKTNKASFDTHTLVINGSTNVTINNVLIGEVWFCSGQSNMEMPLKGFNKSVVNNSEAYLNAANNTSIRLFNNNKSASLLPQTNVNGVWEESTKVSAAEFSAIGYMFSKKILDNLNVPIGIIESSWGGTRIEPWIPKDSLLKYTDIKHPEVLPTERNKQKLPSLLYNAMIYPFQNYTVKGFLWYQGETSRNNPKPYKAYLHTLINSWRAQWGKEKLPFYVVQIAPYAYNKLRKTVLIYPDLIREAQLQTANEMINTGLVVTTDVGKCDDIHPPEKEIIANRLANWALANQYNISGIDYRSPEYKSMKTKSDKIILNFEFFSNNKEHWFFDSNKTIKSFQIAGADKKFYPAKVKINKNQTLTIYSKEVVMPKAVRYGFEDCLEGSLFSISGLPVSSFRTDNWN